jgi:hypothetical protein
MVWLCGPDSKRTDALTIGSVNYDEESGEFWGFFDRGDEPFFTGEDEAHERRFFEALGFRTTDH